MSEQRLVLVTGATGAQGGGVARHLLRSAKFRVRCLTRKANSAKAAELRQAGAELAEGDLEDSASLRAALDGCYGAFGVTNFWEHFGKEYAQGKNLVDAVKASDVQHFVFSTLPSSKSISGGTHEVPHFDMKARLEEYARELGIPSTFVHVAFYFENFLTYFPPQKQADGSYSFGFPQGDTALAGVAVEDVGGVVAAIFEKRAEMPGRTVGIAGDDLTGAEYADILSRTLGRTIRYNHIPREVYAAFGFPGAQELADMFDFNRLYIPERKADVAASRSLYPAMRTFETWAAANLERF